MKWLQYVSIFILLLESAMASIEGLQALHNPRAWALKTLAPHIPPSSPLLEELVRLAGLLMTSFGILLGHAVITDIMYKAGKVAHSHLGPFMRLVLIGDTLQLWLCYKMYEAMDNTLTVTNGAAVVVTVVFMLARVMWLGVDWAPKSTAASNNKRVKGA